MRSDPQLTTGALPALLGVLCAWGVLRLWQAAYAELHCLLLLPLIGVVALLIAASTLEGALLRRRAWLRSYLRGESWLFSLLRGGALLLTWHLLKGLLLALVLLLGVLRWPTHYWLLLLADALLLWLAVQGLSRWLPSHVRPGFAPILARQWLVLVNTLLCGGALLALAYYSPLPDLRGSGLLAGIEAEVATIQLACPELALLVRLDSALHHTGWWLVQSGLSHPALLFIAPLAWLFFLALYLAFLWIYSRMLLGAMLSPENLLHWLAQDTPAPFAARGSRDE